MQDIKSCVVLVDENEAKQYIWERYNVSACASPVCSRLQTLDILLTRNIYLKSKIGTTCRLWLYAEMNFFR